MTRGDFLKVARVDADRKAFHAGALSIHIQHISFPGTGTEFLQKRAPKIVGISLSLHSDEIKIHDRAQKIRGSRKCSEHLRSRPWNMMKVPNQIGDAERSQFRCQRDQMIIMYPHEIAYTEKLRKRFCKCTIDPQITGIVGSREIGQAYSVVHRWPERAIRKTIIVFPTVKRCQIHEHVLNIPFVDHSGLGSRMGGYLAAPAQPETLIGLKRLSQCNGQASSGPFAGGVGNRYAVRYNDEARQRS